MNLRTTIALLVSTLVAGSASATVSVFNFNTDGDFSSSGPATMSLFKGNPFGSFGTDTVNGVTTGVYNFPVATKTQGLEVFHNAPANGGGAFVNEYTIGYDVKFNNASGYASFFQTDPTGNSDADLFRNGAGGIGISSKYAGTMLSDTWYRVMFSFDIAGEIGPAKTLYKYINGVQVGTQVLAYGVDSRWALDPSFVLFTDEDGETNAGAISSFSFEDRALTASQVANYGGPSASGIACVPEPSSLALLAFGVLPMLRRRRTNR